MSLESLGRAIGDLQERRPMRFLLMALLVTLATLPGLPLLINHVEPSIEKVLPQDVEVVQTMNAMRSQYGADMMYLVLQPYRTAGTVVDMRSPDVLRYEDLLAAKLRERQSILEVQTLADFVRRDNGGTLPIDADETRRLIANDPASGLFLGADDGVGIIHIRSDTGASAQLIRETVEAIDEDVASLTADNPGVKVHLTGFNAIDKATFEIIIADFASITLWSFLFMLAFLFLYYKGSVRKVLLSISVIMLALIWTLGLTGYLGITITVVTMVAAAMIMALGISYGIHTVHRYSELREEHPPGESLVLMQEELLRAMLGSSLTTSAGFLALLFGVLPAMKNLGVILAMGIVITLAATVLVVPVIIRITDDDRKKHRGKESKKREESEKKIAIKKDRRESS